MLKCYFVVVRQHKKLHQLLILQGLEANCINQVTMARYLETA